MVASSNINSHDMETLSALLTDWSEIHQSTVDFPNKGLVVWSFDVFFVISLDKVFNKQSRGRWLSRYEVHVTSLWSGQIQQ